MHRFCIEKYEPNLRAYVGVTHNFYGLSIRVSVSHERLRRKIQLGLIIFLFFAKGNKSWDLMLEITSINITNEW